MTLTLPDWLRAALARVKSVPTWGWIAGAAGVGLIFGVVL